MATRKTRILVRRDTFENWNAAGTILEEGELGYDKTSKGLKVGDGHTAFANLPFVGTEIIFKTAVGWSSDTTVYSLGTVLCDLTNRTFSLADGTHQFSQLEAGPGVIDGGDSTDVS